MIVDRPIDRGGDRLRHLVIENGQRGIAVKTWLASKIRYSSLQSVDLAR